MPHDDQVRRIFVLSDGTGHTGKRVLDAALLQFDDTAMVIRLPYIRTVDEVKEVVAEVVQRGGMIAYTLVAVELRQAVRMAATEQGVIAVDLLGGLLGQLQYFLHRSPWSKPGLLHPDDEEYLQRVEAMEFTVRHDDGHLVQDLAEADLVLVGVSRTSKTPVSFYLAYRGWKVANVPIIRGTRPPPTLTALDGRHVVGLTIAPEHLALIRRTRLKHLRLGEDAAYIDPQAIHQELRYGLELCQAHHWPVVDVTGKAVEETANEVVRLMMPSPSGVEVKI